MSEVNWDVMDFNEFKQALDHRHGVNSSVNVGERVAAMVNAQSRSELIQIVRRAAIENTLGDLDELRDSLNLTENDLQVRLHLVQCALGRIDVAINEAAHLRPSPSSSPG